MTRSFTQSAPARASVAVASVAQSATVSCTDAAAIESLLGVVGALHDLMRQLLELAKEKLVALRTADAEDLHACATRECRVLERLFAREKERDAVLARLAQSLPASGASAPRLSVIAEQIPEPFSSRLRAKIAGLRQTAEELRQKNRLAAEVARSLHKHLRAIFSEIAGVNQETLVYGPGGREEPRATRTWVDAVG